MIRFVTKRSTFLLALTALAACSGGSSDSNPILGGTFDVLTTEPLNGGRLFLNDPIRFDFSTPVDLASADLNTVSFSVFDLNGNPVAEQPTGHFDVDQRPGDDTVGRRLVFVPTLPSNDDFTDGGFRPGRTYLVRLVGGDRHNNTVLRDQIGNGLNNAQTFRFVTADGTTPAQLFRNTLAGGPRRTGFSVTPPAENTGVALNKFCTPAVEVRLSFNQALNPNSSNVPVALDLDPVKRSGINKGRIFLQYQEGLNKVWIPANVDIEVNDATRSTVVLRPVGVLPNNATVEVIVESTMEDISGESNVGNAAYNSTFATFQTQPLYDAQFDSLVEDFQGKANIDFDAPFLEPQAEVGNGFVRAGFEFEGTTTQLDYNPTTPEVVLNTDFTQIAPANGLPFNVSGGVFNFRNVTIGNGVFVKGQGTRPMVWLVSGDFIVNGKLTVGGGDGVRVNGLNSANIPAAGGIGVCGGGNGGRGSPVSTARSFTGQAGFGPGQKPGGGGGGGRLSCTSCDRGSGGGGGSLATQGDPSYGTIQARRRMVGGTGFQQVDGIGGAGCVGNANDQTRVLAGGAPGPRVFTDARADNDFWGQGVNLQRQIRIRGELTAPVGGGGGGGGGNRSPTGPNSCAVLDQQFINDNRGGGGGGGGGVLIVKALGHIVIGPTGSIDADGGHGAGGEQAGSCNQGGGGGAGSGGMVILMSATDIDITAKGTNTGTVTLLRYAQDEYRFAISADGGICRTGQFGDPDIEQKYALIGTSGPAVPAAEYDKRPLGAFGGMGVVQLMAPPGDPTVASVDGTNTVLDDHIIYRNHLGAMQSGLAKQQLLAWRGFPNLNNVPVDDNNNATAIGTAEGDIRPTPLLLPVPFNAITRVRSKWIDLGAAKRRSVTAPNGEPRSITDPTNTLAGPTYTFTGVQNVPGDQFKNGYASFQVVGSSARVDYPAVLATPATLLSAAPTAPFRGQPAYRIDLTSPVLGNEADRYVGYEAELLNGTGTVLASFRIMTHSDRALLVDATDGLLPASATGLQVRAKFFRVLTDGAEGLGSTYTSLSGAQVPLSSVRIGFAFHTNPDPTLSGQTRFPTSANSFAYNLADPAVVESLRVAGMQFVQWDVQFNARYVPTAADNFVNPRPFGSTSPRPELRFLRLPFRF